MLKDDIKIRIRSNNKLSVIAFLLCVLLLICILSGCAKSKNIATQNESTASQPTRAEEFRQVSYDDLAGKLAGVMEKKIQDGLVKDHVKNPRFAYFTTTADETQCPK